MTQNRDFHISHRPKQKQLITFLSEFIYLNYQLKLKPYSVSITNLMLLELEGFHCDISLGQKIVYYHIQISEGTNKLC